MTVPTTATRELSALRALRRPARQYTYVDTLDIPGTFTFLTEQLMISGPQAARALFKCGRDGRAVIADAYTLLERMPESDDSPMIQISME